MIQKLQTLIRQKFFAGASILTFLTLGSYAMGFLRDRTLLQTFGASRSLDIYNASFQIPDLLLNIFVAGALSAAFVPVFTHLWSHGEKEKAEKLAASVLHAAILTIFAVGTLAFFLMPVLADIVVPKFSVEEKLAFVKLSRLMLLSPLIFAASNTLGGILVSFERFVGYGLSPILYNFGIILGAFIAKIFGIGIYGLLIGTLLGAFLHLFSRALAIFRSGFRFKFPLDFKEKNFLHVVRLMLPKMLGHPVEQLTFLVFANIASAFAAGSITMVGTARNFQSMSVSVFGISLSVAIFSALSRDASLHNRELFVKNLLQSGRAILFFTLFSSLFFLLFGSPIIKILFGGGAFTKEDAETTGMLLAIFAFSIPTESLIHLLARGFYAFKDTVTPVLISLIGLGIITASVNLLKTKIGIEAIPWSFFIGSFIEVILLTLLLWKRIRRWEKPQSSPSSPS